MIVRTEAFLLQAIRFGESSVICRLLTRDRGVVPVIAKGARRPKSRFGTALEPFQRLDVTYYDKSTREIQTLSRAERLRGHPGVTGSLERMEAAGSWLRFLRAVVPEGAPAEPLFRLAALALERLEGTPAGRTRRWEGYHRARAAELLGLAPRLEACAHCGRALPDPTGMGFSVAEGGIVCARCRARVAGARGMDARAYAFWILYHHPDWSLLAGAGEVDRAEGEVVELVHRFLAHHADLGPRAAGRALA